MRRETKRVEYWDVPGGSPDRALILIASAKREWCEEHGIFYTDINTSLPDDWATFNCKDGEFSILINFDAVYPD